MQPCYQRPAVGDVTIRDEFWSPYLEQIRHRMLPYVFRKMDESGYEKNLIHVGERQAVKFEGLAFWDGLLYEVIRAAADFLSQEYDPMLDAYLDKLAETIRKASDTSDGFLSSGTMLDRPQQRWGQNGGNLILQHDLYNHGTLIEAAVSHYLATGKTTLLYSAVRAANCVVREIGSAPKLPLVPGHSMPEEAFVKLYRLFRDHGELKPFAEMHGVDAQAYLDIAEFWQDDRGDRAHRPQWEGFAPEYNQDHLLFAQQTEALGHAVRAMLCYTGAAAVAQERERPDYEAALHTLWDSVVHRKLHISGGVGARHDIEGFAEDYVLPHNAYLETCAGVALAFWNGEMHRLEPDAQYYDCFELSLYNNILTSVGQDFRHFFYENPLVSDGTVRRWEWHGCPCCPPMMLKLMAALGSYIYAYTERSLMVNLWIGSRLETEHFTVEQQGKQLCIDSKGQPLEVHIRVPFYAENFALSCGGEPLPYRMEQGYAVVAGVWTAETPIFLSYTTAVRYVRANPLAQETRGQVAVLHGPVLLCAEGIDNGGRVDFTLSAQPPQTVTGTGLADETVTGMAADGSPVRLIPYYRWCNRFEKPTDAAMAVWFRCEGMPAEDTFPQDGRLYDYC